MVVNEVFEATVEERLIHPTFVIDYPAVLCPLAKPSRKDPQYAERFELFVAGHTKGVFQFESGGMRDVLTRMSEHYERVRLQPVRAIMTPQPVFLYETASPAKVINLMAVGGFRHVPVLDVDNRVVGVVGPRRILNYLEPHLLPA
jgi:hypothetical protein